MALNVIQIKNTLTSAMDLINVYGFSSFKYNMLNTNQTIFRTGMLKLSEFPHKAYRLVLPDVMIDFICL